MAILDYGLPKRRRWSFLALASILFAVFMVPAYLVVVVGYGFSGHATSIANIAMVLLLACGPAIISLACGIAALRRIRMADGNLRGKMLAWCGVVLAASFLFYILGSLVLYVTK